MFYITVLSRMQLLRMCFGLASLIARCVLAYPSCVLCFKMLLQYNVIWEDYGSDCVETLNCTSSFRRNFRSEIGISWLLTYSGGYIWLYMQMKVEQAFCFLRAFPTYRNTSNFKTRRPRYKNTHSEPCTFFFRPDDSLFSVCRAHFPGSNNHTFLYSPSCFYLASGHVATALFVVPQHAVGVRYFVFHQSGEVPGAAPPLCGWYLYSTVSLLISAIVPHPLLPYIRFIPYNLLL